MIHNEECPDGAESELASVSTPSVRKSTLSRWLPLSLLVVAVSILSACAGENGQNGLKPRGENADTIWTVTSLIGISAIVVATLVSALVIFIVIRFRSTPETYDDLPEQIHGHQLGEILWTAIPALFLVFIAVFTVPKVFTLDSQDKDDMTVIVEGQQWWWQFSYDLDSDGVFDIVTSNDIVFPAGEQVNLKVTSNDVIHSFWVPELNGKKDAVPGRVHNWKIHAHEPGVYGGLCAEYCGLSHADMRLKAVALSEADWNEWVARQTTDQEPIEGDSAEARGYQLFGQFCSSCHVINGVYESASENEPPLLSGVAPNLTHLLSRLSFAGGIFDMYLEDGSVNDADLVNWVHDAPGRKPLAPDNLQGMISFADQLNVEQVADIVAYLKTLGDEPILPSN